MKIEVLDRSGKDTGRKIDLADDIFKVTPNDHAIYLDVKGITAAGRQGTHKAKERAEINGSTKKIKKQKGTGTARAGSMKSPVFRGGGRVFGPRPKSYNLKINKKVKDLARKSVLSYIAQEKRLMVIEDFTLETPKTKEFISFYKNIEVEGKKVLFVTSDIDKNLMLSGRNIPKSKIIEIRDINTYDLLNSENLILTESSVEKLHKIFE